MQIKENGEPTLKKYLSGFKAGGFDFPNNFFLSESELDMTEEEPYRALIRRMESIMGRIEAVLDKKGK